MYAGKSTAYLLVLNDWHNNFTFACTITGNVPRKLLHVRHKLRLLRFGRSSADATPEGNGLACYLAMEWSEQELLWVRGVEKVESTPVDA